MITNLEEIIKGCVAEKAEAQNALYKHYSAKMYAICLRYSGNEDDAKDILQEGFIKIFQKITQYKGSGSFEGWMRKIIVNTALLKYRDKYFLYTTSDDESYITLEHNENALDSLSAQDLLSIIKQLSPQYRTVFNLFAIEGYSHKEISELLNISEGTSKSNLARARGILQQKIKKMFQIARQIS